MDKSAEEADFRDRSAAPAPKSKAWRQQLFQAQADVPSSARSEWHSASEPIAKRRRTICHINDHVKVWAAAPPPPQPPPPQHPPQPPQPPPPAKPKSPAQPLLTRGVPASSLVAVTTRATSLLQAATWRPCLTVRVDGRSARLLGGHISRPDCIYVQCTCPTCSLRPNRMSAATNVTGAIQSIEIFFRHCGMPTDSGLQSLQVVQQDGAEVSPAASCPSHFLSLPLTLLYQSSDLYLACVCALHSPLIQVSLTSWILRTASQYGGSGLVGHRLCAYWYAEPSKSKSHVFGRWYAARVVGYDSHSGEHTILYDEDESEAKVYLPLSFVHFGATPPAFGQHPVMMPANVAVNPFSASVSSQLVPARPMSSQPLPPPPPPDGTRPMWHSVGHWRRLRQAHRNAGAGPHLANPAADPRAGCAARACPQHSPPSLPPPPPHQTLSPPRRRRRHSLPEGGAASPLRLSCSSRRTRTTRTLTMPMPTPRLLPAPPSAGCP